MAGCEIETFFDGGFCLDGWPARLTDVLVLSQRPSGAPCSLISASACLFLSCRFLLFFCFVFCLIKMSTTILLRVSSCCGDRGD